MNTKRTMLVVAHVGRPAALRSARLVVDRLTAARIAVRILEPEAADLRCAGADVVPATPDAAQDAEMVIVLGGDGTLLRRRRSPGPLARRCSASTSAISGSSPRRSPMTWPAPSTRWWSTGTRWKSG